MCQAGCSPRYKVVGESRRPAVGWTMSNFCAQGVASPTMVLAPQWASVSSSMIWDQCWEDPWL